MTSRPHAALPRFEAERLRELYSLKLLDIQIDERFQRYTRLASDVLEAPIAFISLVGRDRLWFKSSCGLSPGETSRSASFCTLAVAADALLVVEDTLRDPRFAANPLVLNEPHLRFYAGQPIHGPSGQPLGTLCVFDHSPRTLSDPQRSRLALLAELVEREIHQSYQLDLLREDLERNAYYDSLTGLPNERLVRERLDFAVRLANQRDGAVLVAMLDVRGFSAINHNFGTETGDALLRLIAAHLNRSHPDPCIVGRWIDDQFVIADPDASITPAEFGQTILREFGQSFRLRGHSHHLDVELGIAGSSEAGADATTLLRNATTAMRANAGTNTGFRLYTPSLEVSKGRRQQIASRLRHAIAHSEIELAYQPKVDGYGRHLKGVEALARWHDPDLGTVPAAEFIAVAEAEGLIDPLGEQLLWVACAQAAAWQQQGLVVPVAVNLSALQLHQPNLVSKVQAALRCSGLSGDRLYLEITEGALISDIASAVGVLHELNELGVRVALDDFGTGYCSYAYLAELPAAAVKIDRHFVTPVATQEAAGKVVTSIIGLAHGLGMSVVAEGVETEDQLRFLQRSGCDELQGHYFSAALPAHELEHFARRYTPGPTA